MIMKEDHRGAEAYGKGETMAKTEIHTRPIEEAQHVQQRHEENKPPIQLAHDSLLLLGRIQLEAFRSFPTIPPPTPPPLLISLVVVNLQVVVVRIIVRVIVVIVVVVASRPRPTTRAAATCAPIDSDPAVPPLPRVPVLPVRIAVRGQTVIARLCGGRGGFGGLRPVLLLLGSERRRRRLVLRHDGISGSGLGEDKIPDGNERGKALFVYGFTSGEALFGRRKRARG